jgi:hypothetical protein
MPVLLVVEQEASAAPVDESKAIVHVPAKEAQAILPEELEVQVAFKKRKLSPHKAIPPLVAVAVEHVIALPVADQ